MKKKNINWETIDEQIKNLKFPLTFIYNIIKNQDIIEDYNLSLILRFFFKNQTEVSMNYPLFIMTNILDDTFVITKKVINDFYSSILKKHLFIKILLKFKSSYDNKSFWDKNIVYQKEYIEKGLLIFKAHFDASLSGLNGVTKLVSQLRYKNNTIILKQIKERLSDSLKFMGLQFFKNIKFEMISEEDFDSLSPTDKIKFIICFYLKTEKYFNLLINVYDLLNIYDIKIKQIISPKPIYINFDTIYSDNDSEDINLITEY